LLERLKMEIISVSEAGVVFACVIAFGIGTYVGFALKKIF